MQNLFMKKWLSIKLFDIYGNKNFFKFKPQTDLASDRYHKLFLSGIVVSPIPARQWKTFSTFAIQVGYTNSKFGISFNLYPEMWNRDEAIFQLQNCFPSFSCKTNICHNQNIKKLKSRIFIKNLRRRRKNKI